MPGGPYGIIGLIIANHITFLIIQQRMADWHFAQAESWAEPREAHDRWVADYNYQLGVRQAQGDACGARENFCPALQDRPA